MTYLPIALFWLLAIWAVFSTRPVLLYLFFASIPFGAFAVVPTNLTAGLTFTATPIVSLLLIIRAFMSRSGPGFFLTYALQFNRLGMLFLFWVVAVLTTIFMPRLFAGEVRVVPIRGELNETTMLMPTPQNISQLVYITIAVFSVFAFTKILRSKQDRQRALKAMCFGGLIVGLTGLVDFASQYVSLDFVLAPFRTATYALAVDVEVLGSKRVVGLMPEASAYGGICLGFLCSILFFRRAIANPRVRNVHAPAIIILLILCCWLSKSSGTYVGLAILGVVLAAEALLRSFSGGRTRHLYRQDLVGELSVVFSLFVLGLMVVLINPDTLQDAYEVIDRMVLQKPESASYEGRGMWRQVALEGIFATGGLGVGLGGARSSSSVVAIFSGTGILGGLLFFGFLLQTLLRRSTHMDWEGQFILGAFRFSFLPPFVVDAMVGGSDFGGLQAFGYGIVTATVFSHANVMARRQARNRARGRHSAFQPGVAGLPQPSRRDMIADQRGAAGPVVHGNA